MRKPYVLEIKEGTLLNTSMSVMTLASRVEEKFQKLFKHESLLVRSPGRVNFIGEHTDYNHGFVLPAAIDKAIYLAIGLRRDRSCKIHALDMEDDHEFDLDHLGYSKKGWPNYVMGVVEQFIKGRKSIGGFECVFGGDIPIGAGLSSSAALEAGLAFSLNRVFESGMDDLSLVKLAQKAENEFVGVQCGIMDQYVNIFGKAKKVLRIDCRSLEHEYYPFENDVSVVLFNSGVSHSLASTEYNRRSEECAVGVEAMRRRHSYTTQLRDVSPEMLNEAKAWLDATIYRRCKYVVEENERVQQACRALEQGNLRAFGRLMVQTHEGLRNDFEVSCKELDVLVDLAKDEDGVYGCRMMGGGFGGCTINLVEKKNVERVGTWVREGYRQRFGSDPKMYIAAIGSGTCIGRGMDYANV